MLYYVVERTVTVTVTFVFSGFFKYENIKIRSLKVLMFLKAVPSNHAILRFTVAYSLNAVRFITKGVLTWTKWTTS